MPILSASDLFSQAYALYQQEEYARALDLLERDGDRFPEWEGRVYFWKTCLASRKGDIPHALRLFAAATEAGHWYPEGQLRADADLRPLQGLPAFENLVTVCRERQAEAQARAVPTRVVIEPAKSVPHPYPLLLALHGNNSNARETARFWQPAVTKGWLVAVPQSSQVGGPDAYVWNDWEWARREVHTHVAELGQQYAVDPTRILLGGFSMGARLAIWLSLAGGLQALGFIAVCPYLPLEDSVDWASLPPVAGAPVPRGVVIAGERDTPSCDGARSLVEQLNSKGIQCQLEIHERLGHDYPPAFGVSLGGAIEFIAAE